MTIWAGARELIELIMMSLTHETATEHTLSSGRIVIGIYTPPHTSILLFRDIVLHHLDSLDTYWYT